METAEMIKMIREGVRGCDPGDTMISPGTGKIICVAELLEVADRLERLDRRWKRTRAERDGERKMRERAERLLAEELSRKPSGDLISREALLEEFRWLKSVVIITSAPEVEEYMSRIENAPAVEAEPVVRGRWKGAGMGDYLCSVCDETVSGNSYRRCPYCGAHMSEEVSDG